MGRIHSIETMGALDGPGIRTIVYFQGCYLRCLYCHNPDTWNLQGGYEIGVKELVDKVEKYKPYYTNKGGVTFSGGEPLVQHEFLLECLKECKKRNIHTTLDTSGVGSGNYDEILKYTDLVILDIKHESPEGYEKITGLDMKEYQAFKQAIKRKKQLVWLKHVVVPGLTDDIEHIRKLKKEIFSFDNIEKIELLPYHTMGITKYEALNMNYRLQGVPEMDREKIKELQNMLLQCSINTDNSGR